MIDKHKEIMDAEVIWASETLLVGSYRDLKRVPRLLYDQCLDRLSVARGRYWRVFDTEGNFLGFFTFNLLDQPGINRYEATLNGAPL
jgi:hypothetical protein